jgi:hypothetical protein
MGRCYVTCTLAGSSRAVHSRSEAHRRVPHLPIARRDTHQRSPSPFSPSERHIHPAAAVAMPTPESELFLAKKPKVAPTFEGVDYDDNTALKAAQDAIIREQWVKSMMARLVRDEMGKCYRREGVNHLEKCGHLRGRSTLLSSILAEANTG